MYTYNARSGLREVVNPVCDYMEADLGIPCGPEARTLLLAIAGQESGWTARRQYGFGPARGLWQFEKWGGVAGVLTHHSTRHQAIAVCQDQFVNPTIEAAYEALMTNDMLACAFARLLMWTDPFALPTSQSAAWAMYLRTWRPGKPREHHWPVNWFQACGAMEAATKGWRALEIVNVK
jgi:hypothetical protein